MRSKAHAQVVSVRRIERRSWMTEKNNLLVLILHLLLSLQARPVQERHETHPGQPRPLLLADLTPAGL